MKKTNNSKESEKQKYGYDLKNKLDVYVNTSNGPKKISSITKEHSFLKLLSKIHEGIFTIKDIDKDTLQIKSLYLDKKKYYMDEFLLRLDFFNIIKNGSAGGLLKEISIYELLMDYALLDLETTKGFDTNTIEILKNNRKIIEDIIFMKDQILFNKGIIINNNVEIKKIYDNIKTNFDLKTSITLDNNILLIKYSLEKFLKYVIKECYDIGLGYYKFIIPREILRSIRLDNIFFFINEDEEKIESMRMGDDNIGENIDYKKIVEFIREKIINKEYYTEVESFCIKSGEDINEIYINDFNWFGNILGIQNNEYKKNVNYLFDKENITMENNNINKDKYYQNKNFLHDNENDILEKNKFISKIINPNTYNLIKFKNGFIEKSILLHLISKTNFIYDENGKIIRKIYPYINKEIYNKKDLLLALNSNIDKIEKNEDDINILIDIILKNINELKESVSYNELGKNIIYYSKDLSEIDYIFGPYTHELLKDSFKYCENKFKENSIKNQEGVFNIYKVLEIIKDKNNQIEIFKDIKQRINNLNNISIGEAFIPIVNIITNFIKLLEKKLEIKDLEEISIYGILLNLLSDIELKKIMKINLIMLKEINDKSIFNDKILINPLQIGKSKSLFLLGKTGSGKSLIFNKFIDSYNNTNNTIIYFNTVKDRDINIRIDKIINNTDEFLKFNLNDYIGRKILIDINFSKIINDNEEKLNSLIINKIIEIRSIAVFYDNNNHFSDVILAIPDFTIISMLFNRNNNEEKLNEFISGYKNGNILISDSLINLSLLKNKSIQNLITFGLDYSIIEETIKNGKIGFDPSNLNYTSFLDSYFIFRKTNGDLLSKKIIFLN